MKSQIISLTEDPSAVRAGRNKPSSSLLTLLFFLTITTSSGWAVPLYTQPFDQTGVGYASQNDIGGGYGNFATTYDNFYFGNNAAPAGQPNNLIATWHIQGTGNETFMGSYGGFPTYSYDVFLPGGFNAVSNIQYWISLVPDLDYPPQWSWSTGTGGDGHAVQDFMADRLSLDNDLAFTLLGTGNSFNEVQFVGGYFNPPEQGPITGWTVSLYTDGPLPSPEPGSLVMLGTGALGVAGVIRRKLLA